MSSRVRTEELLPLSSDEWLSVTRDQVASRGAKTVICCHGLSGDKVGPQRLLSRLSETLAVQCEINVIRFDFRGSGLSSGQFQESTLSSMKADALRLADTLAGPLVWMGISTGALVALMASSERGRQEPLLAISNGFAEEITFTKLDQDPLPIRDGQVYLPLSYFAERQALRPMSRLIPACGPINVILGDQDTKHFREADELRQRGVRVHTIPGGDHLYTLPSTRKQLFDKVKELIDEAS